MSIGLENVNCYLFIWRETGEFWLGINTCWLDFPCTYSNVINNEIADLTMILYRYSLDRTRLYLTVV
jgi:hypothetical protein